MPELQFKFSRQRRWMFSLLSIYVLGWGFTSYQTIFLGLVFGTSLSLFNLWLMVRKMKQFDESVSQGRKVRSLGSFSRFATAALAVVVSMRYPEQLNLISVVIGLMTSYIVIMIDFFMHSLQIHK
ncbi:AtpI protein [Neobacillus bataviensis LMG 21833]|uniref:AtpI protein n=1 Tax=Neobacillus bataviensis LMG 21833 TaxID=1117379 RepID=K6D287_9BACI|nr:ATP synthase subunit I [Neobacillus bataviensis]EKN66592.1 AtpI protein [Neobacillus bataviensis LMG 21833]